MLRSIMFIFLVCISSFVCAEEKCKTPKCPIEVPIKVKVVPNITVEVVPNITVRVRMGDIKYECIKQSCKPKPKPCLSFPVEWKNLTVWGCWKVGSMYKTNYGFWVRVVKVHEQYLNHTRLDIVRI